MSSFNQPARW